MEVGYRKSFLFVLQGRLFIAVLQELSTVAHLRIELEVVDLDNNHRIVKTPSL